MKDEFSKEILADALSALSCIAFTLYSSFVSDLVVFTSQLLVGRFFIKAVPLVIVYTPMVMGCFGSLSLCMPSISCVMVLPSLNASAPPETMAMKVRVVFRVSCQYLH
jgi:hypothetical protein